MSLHIVTRDVSGVFMAGEWFDVEPGSFRIDAYEFADVSAEEYIKAEAEPVLYGNNGPGFEFVSRESGDVFAGPFTSIVAVRRKGEERTGEASLQRLAAMLRGEIHGNVVHFAHAGRLFGLRFGPNGWACSSRDGGTYSSSSYSLQEDDRAEEIANQVMGDLKAEFGLGR